MWDVLSNEEVATVVMKSGSEAGAANAVAEAAANAWSQKYPTAKVDDISVVCLSINKSQYPQPQIWKNQLVENKSKNDDTTAHSRLLCFAYEWLWLYVYIYLYILL